jgi:hypothetical protein
VPGFGGGGEKPKKKSFTESVNQITFGKEGGMSLSQEDLDQIVGALKPAVAEMVAEAIAGPGGKGVGAPPPNTDVTGLADDALNYSKEDEDAAEKAMKECGGAKPAVMKYRKENEDYRVKYAKVFRELGEVKADRDRLAIEAAKAGIDGQRAMRFSKLQALANEGYQVDPAEEIKDCDPATMPDADFAKHEQRIKLHYSRVPLGGLIHEPATVRTPAPAPEEAAKSLDRRISFSKQAAKNVLEARERGQELDYVTERKRLEKEAAASAA